MVKIRIKYKKSVVDALEEMSIMDVFEALAGIGVFREGVEFVNIIETETPVAFGMESSDDESEASDSPPVASRTRRVGGGRKPVPVDANIAATVIAHLRKVGDKGASKAEVIEETGLDKKILDKLFLKLVESNAMKKDGAARSTRYFAVEKSA